MLHEAGGFRMSNELDLVNIYSLLTPIAIVMIVIETVYVLFKKKEYISFFEAVTNMGTAIGNQCVNLGVAFLVVWSFGYVYEYRFFTIPTTFWNFCLLLVAFDFFFYWFHRHGHAINILWAAHMPHHSSEEFNLFVGVRASITQRLFSFTYLWPLALVGFRPEAIYAASAVQLMIALWHHTRVIKKMGWYEIIFNSPAYHRVHHAINDKYLDKNFGEIFIIWDKMFGTYAKEEEEPIYGCLTPIQSCNPNKIYVQFWKALFIDMVNTKSWWDKIRLWFMPLGWRPDDVKHIQRYRINEKTFVKYNVEVPTTKKAFLVLQVALGLYLMSSTINLNIPFTMVERLSLIFSLWLMIMSWGKLLESEKSYAKFEGIRLFLTMMTMYFINQNHGANNHLMISMVLIITTGLLQFVPVFKVMQPQVAAE
jgi:sterol desaturase/sphingolipid hydroxylase (fatty acid hydroxylase superfamily)